MIRSDRSLAPILQRFASVVLLDSSTFTLPDEMQTRFRGCGGSYGSGAAAMKLQTEFDLRSGALFHVQIEAGRSPDGATNRQQARRGEGSLRISDLGYFNVAVFAKMAAAKEYFLSRLQFGTAVLTLDGQTAELLSWLAKQPGPFVDQPILLGKEQRLPCRLIAWRLPVAQANERRRKLRLETMRKRGQEPSAERLAWCDWTILVTNVPPDMLTPPEAAVFYRGAVANRTSLQALEIARLGGGAQRVNTGSANGPGLVTFDWGRHSTLALAGQCLGRSNEELEQSLRSNPPLCWTYRGRAASSVRIKACPNRSMPGRRENMPPKSTYQTGNIRIT